MFVYINIFVINNNNIINLCFLINIFSENFIFLINIMDIQWNPYIKQICIESIFFYMFPLTNMQMHKVLSPGHDSCVVHICMTIIFSDKTKIFFAPNTNCEICTTFYVFLFIMYYSLKFIIFT